MIIWLHPNDCDPPHGLNMGDWEKVKRLYTMFVAKGFDLTKSALVGYPLNGRVQLLSGTHRHRAAKVADILLPVTLWLRSDIEAYWGKPEWSTVMQDIPVEELIGQ